MAPIADIELPGKVQKRKWIGFKHLFQLLFVELKQNKPKTY